MITLFALNGSSVHINPDHVVGVKAAADGKGIILTSIGTEIKVGIEADLCAELLRKYPDDWAAKPVSYTLKGSPEREYWGSKDNWNSAKTMLGRMVNGPLQLRPVPLTKGLGGSVQGLLMFNHDERTGVVCYADSIKWAFDVVLPSGSVVQFDHNRKG